jgi:hypothetical protein
VGSTIAANPIPTPVPNGPQVVPQLLDGLKQVLKLPAKNAGSLITDATHLSQMDGPSREAYLAGLGWDRFANTDGTTRQVQFTTGQTSSYPLGEYGTGQAYFPQPNGGFDLWTMVEFPLKGEADQRIESITWTPGAKPGDPGTFSNGLAALP